MNTLQTASFRNLYAFGKKLPIDLSLSENPLGCSPKVSLVLRNLKEKEFSNYPDPDCTQLKKVLARRFNLNLSNLFVANGSEALIKELPQLVLNTGDEVIIPELTFPMFAIASHLAKGKVILTKMTADLAIDIEDIESKITSKTKLIFICNPNNPTGKAISRKEIIDLLSATKASVVIDEANIEFGGQTVIREIKKFKNLVVLRTFSKGFGLAGFRIGFCAANQNIIQSLQQTSQPFPVSTLAEKAALIALADTEFINKTREYIKKEREFLTSELSKRGFNTSNSQANNILIQLPVFSTTVVTKLNSLGISVVDGAAFNFKKCNFIRVSTRLRKTNLKFLQALDLVFQELKRS